MKRNKIIQQQGIICLLVECDSQDVIQIVRCTSTHIAALQSLIIDILHLIHLSDWNVSLKHIYIEADSWIILQSRWFCSPILTSFIAALQSLIIDILHLIHLSDWNVSLKHIYRETNSWIILQSRWSIFSCQLGSLWFFLLDNSSISLLFFSP